MRRQRLRSAIERLERRHKKRPLPPRVLCQTFDTNLDDATGFQCGNLVVLRQSGETVHETAERAFRLSGSYVIAAIMPENGSASAPESVSEVEASPVPVDAWKRSEAPEIGIGSPGVGRIATRAELIKFGVIANRPERLID